MQSCMDEKRSHRLFEEGIDQLLPIAEASVERADPNPGLGSDVLKRDLQPVLSEEPSRSLKDPLSVALGVCSEPGPDYVCVHSHRVRVSGGLLSGYDFDHR